MNRTLKLSILYALLLLFPLFVGLSGAAGTETTESISLGEGHGGGCTIVYTAGEKLSAQTAGKLAEYIQTHAGWRPAVAADDKYTDAGGSLVVIDGTPDHCLATKFGQPVAITSDWDEAFVLKTASHNGRPLVIVVGKTAKGAKYAAQELSTIRRLEILASRLRKAYNLS